MNYIQMVAKMLADSTPVRITDGRYKIGEHIKIYLQPFGKWKIFIYGVAILGTFPTLDDAHYHIFGDLLEFLKNHDQN